MATVKLRTVDGLPRVLTKLAGEERRVSCSCCGCFCDQFRCSLLAKGFAAALKPTKINPPQPAEEEITVEFYNSQENQEQLLGVLPLTYHGQFGSGWSTDAGKPAPVSFVLQPQNVTIWAGWGRSSFCFRFVCREISTQSENGTVICSQLTCGPSFNEANLTERLFQDIGQNSTKDNLLSNETQSGVYVYCFEFFGWRKPKWEDLIFTESVPRDDAYRLYSFFYSPN